MENNYFSLEISKFSLALLPEALVNTSGRVLFSSPVEMVLLKTQSTCLTNTRMNEILCSKDLSTTVLYAVITLHFSV